MRTSFTAGRWRVLTALIAIMALASFAAACGGGDDDGGDGGTPSTNINIDAKDNSFNPNKVTVPVGQEVTFNLKNSGTLQHNMKVTSDGKATSTEILKAGGTATLKATFSKAGTYDYICELHPTEMTGKITAK